MNRLKPEFVLRLSLAAMYFYSGVDIFLHPKAWTWAVPLWLKDFLNENLITFLKVQAVSELIIATVFLLWFLPKKWVKWLALVSTVEMALILIFSGVDSVTFRDIGLLGASFTLFLIYARK